MSRILPAPSRIQVVHEVGRTKVVVRPRRNTPTLLFLPVWLVGWAFGEVFAIREIIRLLAQEGSGPSWFLAVWLAGWTVGGAVALYTLAYGLRGREEVWVEGGMLRVRSGVGPVGRTRDFELRFVSHLRAEPPGWSEGVGSFYWPGMNRGQIAFDYGARSHRFCEGLGGTDVTAVIELLREHVPDRPTAS